MSALQKHILFISPAFPKTLEEDYIVTYITNYIKALSELRPEYKISIITTGYPKETTQYIHHNAEVHSFGSQQKRPKWKKPLFWRRVIKAAEKINENNKVTAIHALWLSECAVIAQRLSKKWNIAATCTIMGTELHNTNPYLKFINLEKLKLVSVSNRERDYLNKKLNVNSLVIPWGVPRIEVEDKLTNRNNDLLFVGFLNELKNLNLFLEIIKSIKSIRPQIKAKVIGSDYSDGMWEKKIEAMGLSDNILFLGKQKNVQVLREMQQSKIFVHTSSFESQGYAMLEALACGMHVVSKNVGIAKSSNKWILAKDKEAFVSAIISKLDKELDHDPEYNYPISDTIKQYVEAYKLD